MQDTTQALEFAKKLAREAAEIMTQYFDADDKKVELKANASQVTIADKLINQLVIDQVAAKFPSHGVLAEEGSRHEDRKELWVCDPIDGTKGFILGIPTAMFSLAFVVNGRPEVAVMLDPFHDRLYTALRGKGAWANDIALHVSKHATLKGAHIVGPASYKELKDRRTFFDRLLEVGASQLSVPGAVFRSSLVAGGGIEAHLFPGRSAHDIAAAKLVVEEAGGKVTDLYGKEQRYDGRIYGAIISNGHLHDELVKLLKDFGPENYIGY
jgi:myo-inositol-1(or 4)-monophosphatase